MPKRQHKKTEETDTSKGGMGRQDTKNIIQYASSASAKITSVSQNQPAKKSTTKTAGKRYVDTEAWVDRNLDDLIEIFNLNLLELPREDAKAIALRLTEVLRGEAATIDKDTIRRRFTRYIQQMYQLIAQSILELRDELTCLQLEFVVNNIGEAVLGYAPRLYREAMRHDREDLLLSLRTTWRTYWVSKRYPILPVECPRCKFNSLMPDLGCIICGASITEEEIKKHVNFDKLLQDFVKQWNEEDVKKAVIYGYVYLNSLGIKPPTQERDKLDIEILLSSREKEYLKALSLGAKGV